MIAYPFDLDPTKSNLSSWLTVMNLAAFLGSENSNLSVGMNFDPTVESIYLKVSGEKRG